MTAVEIEPIYFVLADYGPRIGHAYVERDPAFMGWDATICQLAAGEWDEHPIAVFEADVARGTWRDVSEKAWAAVRCVCQWRERDVPHFAVV